MSITYSPIHTDEYYIKMAEKLIQAGAKEIALKDMAGIGRPVSLGKVVAAIKKQYPEIKSAFYIKGFEKESSVGDCFKFKNNFSGKTSH